MCDKRNSTECMVTLLSGNKFPKIDKCMVWIISFINVNTRFTTLGCCCGHGKYPMTIVIQGKYGRKHGFVKELFSNITIPRKKRFYKKDSEGYYYIPETLEAENGSDSLPK